MNSIIKSFRVLAVSLLFGAPALLPASSGAAQGSIGDLDQVALALEKAIPAFVSSQDYRSASNTAFLLATARHRLDDTAAACAALSQSLEYYRQAITSETGEKSYRQGSGLDEGSDGMAAVRAKFGCNRARSA